MNKINYILFLFDIMYNILCALYYSHIIVKYFLYISRETYIEREPGEKVNDRNDRAIRVACQWYDNHLNFDNHKIKVVLLTDDVKNRQLAAEDGIFVASSRIHFILTYLMISFNDSFDIFIMVHGWYIYNYIFFYSGRLYCIIGECKLSIG